MVEADFAVVGVLEVGPCFVGEGRDQLGELLVQRWFFEAAEAGTWRWVMAGSEERQKRVTVRRVAWERVLGERSRSPMRTGLVMPRSCPVCQAGRRGAFSRRA